MSHAYLQYGVNNASIKSRSYLDLTAMTGRTAGFSLLELLIYAALLTLATSVFLGGDQAARSARLELAVGSVFDALTFARAESMRTGVGYGVALNTDNPRLRVYRRDPSDGSADFAVYHPVTRQLWDIELGALGRTSALTLSLGHAFAAGCTSPRFLVFNAGTPVCDDADQALLSTGSITLSWDGVSRVVTVDGITGRIHL